MKGDAYLHFVTINTGHAIPSRRAEVAQDVLDALEAPLREALAAEPTARTRLPGPDGFELTANAWGRSALVATVWAPPGRLTEPVVTIGLAADSRAGAKLWRTMPHAAGMDRPPAPWLAAWLHPPIERLPSHHQLMLGDLERCLAWTWLERLR